MLAAGAETRVSHVELAALKVFSDEVAPPCDWSHQAAANIAGLRFEYETAYRASGSRGPTRRPEALTTIMSFYPMTHLLYGSS